ncbi:UDP-N-acetylmuramoyl-tripeptide--D-alanyl-D-alanine ligase [Alteromonas lipolytica]|uniref:UDP-N-acetylmuramoyl-tripeptide--D-alanyl-D-alanine ligase n=1 Tax=Alteromonas lipolytica TaxID=1856405 RepID=A0A1E8FA31_9ALTE|nr:UDP-N-acetylmuramoyl-tripeptide--D-alanyl-D-alanine ligase [Alteromonas lipolytica]OFI32636.1 UDP-N-acetylmuramoyl-tripeptide--D-alanyl-D-alanine ligase [Alteromonas lipolytica]GGF74490.1 UDP-N-acetylmuramoyl-tripeptide--D-alanyl-D-alanine ligase [Alteromonas lipolytica]
MITTSLMWIAEQIEGRLTGEDCTISAISTDTRTLTEGALYLALKGTNFDGHGFIEAAEKAGAAAVIASQPVETALPVIYVEDTKLALGQLGAAVKREFNPKTIGITGSSGKTTVKEMCAAILSRRGNVLATAGNFNNEIGVPLTLLRLTPEHEYAVVEMGANHLGEIAYTTNLVKPDVATIVNAAAAHLEGFGSLLGVARAKSEIFKGLGDKGLAIVNQDSQFAEFWLGKLKHQPVQTFAPDSQNSQSDFYATDIIIDLNGCAEFVLHSLHGSTDIRLSIPGMHNVGNALVAAALTMAVGATSEDVKYGLQDMQAVGGRLKVIALTDQVRILDDTYNANVGSVKAAIDTLASFAGRRVLVLGDMGELGEKARYYHEQVGEYAKEKFIDCLYTVGVLSQSASTAFGENGFHFSEQAALITALEQDLGLEQRDLTLLVKGSRSARMENVIAALETSPLGKLSRRREKIAC